MAVAASRGQGRRDDADPGQSRKDQGKTLRRRPRPGRHDRKTARPAAGADRPFGGSAGKSPPPRHHHPRAGHRARQHRQSAGAAAQPPEGRGGAVKPGLLRRVGKAQRAHRPSSEKEWARREERLCPPYRNKNAPARAGAFGVSPRTRRPKRPHSFFRKPKNFFWNRDTRPPRSSSCWAPPIQAGCDLESISRFSLSPGLPQVERVWYSVPSVMTTVIV